MAASRHWTAWYAPAVIPTDYRLERVVVGLIDRLESARRSHADDPERARVEIDRIARAHVDAAIGEFREVGLSRSPEHHAAFLEAEILGTFLPRYRRLALQMNDKEEAGYGLGRLAAPGGRMATIAAGLLVLVLLVRFITVPVTWPLMILAIGAMFLPDVMRMVTRRRHRKELTSLVADMATIQQQALAYLPVEELRVDRDEGRTGPPRERDPT